jgi:ring-1,2-phenylacetyl-CoA epoxidase subunit PaaA
MPEEYRKAATRIIQFHANSEIMGAYIERPFIRQAPSLERKLAASAQVQDEIGYGHLLYRAAENLGGRTRESGPQYRHAHFRPRGNAVPRSGRRV